MIRFPLLPPAILCALTLVCSTSSSADTPKNTTPTLASAFSRLPRSQVLTIAVGADMGLDIDALRKALAEFKGVKRRMELRGEVGGIAVYDDFAHHPTAIASTIDGLRRKVGGKRIVAVLEPRSATMKMGVHRETLGPSLSAADAVWMFAPPDLGWDAGAVVATLGGKARVARSLDELVAGLAGNSATGDQVLIMSNGGFGGLHGKLLEALADRPG